LEGTDYAGFLPNREGLHAGSTPTFWEVSPGFYDEEGLDAAPQSQDPVHQTGTYKTNNGRIKVITQDGFLLADCGNKASLAGVWNGEAYVGKLAVDDKAGWFTIHPDPATLSLQPGSAAWLSQPRPGNEWIEQQAVLGDEWLLDQADSVRPTLDNMLR